MPHGRHIFSKAYDMANSTMCTYPHSDNVLLHWKCVLRCCADCTCINIPYQEYKKGRNKNPQFCFTFITSLDVVLIML